MNSLSSYEFLDHRVQKLEVSNELKTAINQAGSIPPMIKMGYSVVPPRSVEISTNSISYIANLVLNIECTAADQEQNLFKVNARIEGVFRAITDNYNESDFLHFLKTYGITELYVFSVGFLSGIIPQFGKLCSFSFPFLSSKNFIDAENKPSTQDDNAVG